MYPDSSLDTIRRRGEIRIGFQRYTPPFSYATGTDFVPIGYSVDLVHHVMTALATELGTEIQIQPVEVTSASREGLLDAGVIDIECGSTTITEKRCLRYAFSCPIFHTSHRIAMKQQSPYFFGETSRITGITGSTSHMALLADTSHHPAFEFSGQSSINGAFESFCNDPGVHGIVADEVILISLLHQSRTNEVTVLDQRFGGEDYGFLMRQNDKILHAAVDRILKGLISSSGFLPTFSHWFNSHLPVIGLNLGLNLSERLRHPTSALVAPSKKIAGNSTIYLQGDL